MIYVSLLPRCESEPVEMWQVGMNKHSSEELAGAGHARKLRYYGVPMIFNNRLLYYTLLMIKFEPRPHNLAK